MIDLRGLVRPCFVVSTFRMMAVMIERPILNESHFHRMACGDLPGFFALAEEFFDDVREQVKGWVALQEAGDHVQLREEFHRCKGGAAIFGLERLVSLLGSWERGEESMEIDLGKFRGEMKVAMEAVRALDR